MASKSSFYSGSAVTPTQADAIEASVSNAATSASAASTSGTNAANSATASEVSKDASVVAKNASVTAKNSSETAASNSSSSASTATTRANTATAKADIATAKATIATDKAAIATTKASDSATSATASASSASASQTSRVASEAALDSFTDIYLGSKSSAPSTDNDGNSLATGAIYWNSGNNQLYIWNGSAFVSAVFTASGAVASFNSRTGTVTLSSTDVTNASGLLRTGGAMTGAITTNSTFDGRDVAADGVLATNALPKAGGAMTGAITTNSTFDGRDVATDGSKLDSIEASATADQTKADIQGLGIDVPATNLTGTIAAARLSTATTQAESDDSTKIATTAYVVDKITTLIGGAPSTLNDLNELAAAINDDASYNSTLTTALATKLPLSGGTMTGNISHGGNFTLDVAGDITLDADGAEVFFADGGTNYGKTMKSGNDFRLKSEISDGDFVVQGVDNGSIITALTLDMSDAGTAIFNQKVVAKSSSSGDYVRMYAGSGTGKWDIYGSGANLRFGDNDSAGFVQFDTKVGIGTSSPSSPLHVSSSNVDVVRISGSTRSLYFKPDSAGVMLGTGANQAGNGIYFSEASNLLYLQTNSTERMRIDTSGNVLVGTATSRAGSKIVVDGGAADTFIHLDSDSFNGTYESGIRFSSNTISGTNYYQGEISFKGNNNYSGDLTFSTAGGGTTNAPTERMRINSDGKVLINTTSTIAAAPSAMFQVYNPTSVAGVFQTDNAGTQVIGAWNKGNAGTRYLMWFESNSARNSVGNISTNGTSTSYNTSSDYRLKENVVDLTGASARLNQLDVKRFNWITDDTNTLVDGFLAHEVATVVPEAVTGTKDAMKEEEYEVTAAVEEVTDDDGNVTTEAADAVMGTRNVPNYQSIDQSKLVPLLTAALQEALAKIDSMETRLTALEG
mgnify:CR=1 FL=1